MADNINKAEVDEKTGQYLTFILGDEEYGVDILKVQEIRGWESVTNIPNTPEFVLGVVNLRGHVVPIVDLRLRFSLKTAEFNHSTVVIVVKIAQGNAQRTVGMVVDAISDVYIVKDSEVRDAPDFGGAMATEFLMGLATVGEKMVVLLDVDHLVNVGVLEIQQNLEIADAESETADTE